MVTFERIGIDSWSHEINKCQGVNIFQTPEWISFVAKTQNAEPVVASLKEGNQTLGWFTGLIIRKCGFRILGSPFPGWTTSHMGLNLFAGVPRRAALEALTRFAFDELRCVHFEIADRNIPLEEFTCLGFEYIISTGFQVDLSQSEETLLQRMSSACRRCIRKAFKCGVSVEEAHDLEFADDYYAQLKDVFAKQSLVPTYDAHRVHELIKHVYPTGRLLLLRARAPDGRCIGTGIFPAMNKTMYFWGGASWRDSQLMRPNEAIQWYAMRYWKKRGILWYEMGGGEYKRKYGGEAIVSPWCRKAKFRWLEGLRNVARHAQKVRQRCTGKLREYVGS